MDEGYAASHILEIRMTEKESIEIDLSEEDFERLCYVFRLYAVPLKPIENGVEIDIREKEP